MTPKTLAALDALVLEEKEISDLHWKQRDYLMFNGYVGEDGVVTQEGLGATTIPTFPATLMILGSDTAYGRVTLPKGTEVMITWRSTTRGKELVDGFINTEEGMKQVRLYVSPRNTFETRLMPA